MSAPAPAPGGPHVANIPVASAKETSEFTAALKSLAAFVHKPAPVAELKAQSLPAADAQSIVQRHAALQAQVAAAQRGMEALHSEAVLLHQRASASQLSHFAVGSWVVLQVGVGGSVSRRAGVAHSFGQVVRTDPKDGQIKVNMLQYEAASVNALGEPGVWLKPHQIALVAEGDALLHAEIAAQTAEIAAKRAAHAVYASTPCPVAAASSCPRCNHRLCGAYHYVDLSSMSGWQIACAAPQCHCFQCTESKKRGRGIDEREMGCCKCALNRNQCDCCR